MNNTRNKCLGMIPDEEGVLPRSGAIRVFAEISGLSMV